MRIAIVNQQISVAEHLKRTLLSKEDTEVAWISYNGLEAVAKCTEDPPDLLLTDLSPSKISGTEAIFQIMKCSPCPILIVISDPATHTGDIR